jgi:predicted Kef-type K+ transport protein
MEELIWIGPALIFGLMATRIGLPPMVGYLVGGFVLNIYGMSDPVFLTKIGNLGVTLLLFTIGLKLNIKSLLKPYVWAGATLHMLAVVAIFGILIFWISLGGLTLFADVDLKTAFLIAFALSFSSTVFAVKTLEENGEMDSRHGQVAIGILIMQDIIAVIFLAMSTGKIPSVWALGLIALIPLRPVLMNLMTRAGHGELLILYGFSLVFGAYALFDFLGLKGDLGALIIGMMLAAHPSSAEMSKSLNGFKEFLLVGFFLSIGTVGDISYITVLAGFLLALVLIIKVDLYFFIFSAFRLRKRTSAFASINLANYSEFGLIVGSIAFANGWMSGNWIVIISLALTFSFILAAPINKHARAIYGKRKGFLSRFERKNPLPEDLPIDCGTARIAIIGMARLGTGAYDTLREKYGDVLIGTDPDQSVVERHQSEGRNVILADATNEDFWIGSHGNNMSVILLAKRDYEENISIARLIKQYKGKIQYLVTVAEYPDQVESFLKEGVNAVWDFDTEAGTGFAEEVIAQLDKEQESMTGQKTE